MAFDLPTLRKIAYGALAFFSFIEFCLTIARLAYTDNLPRGDPLNGGRSFYDPDIVELLIASMLSMAWSGFIIYTIHRRVEHNLVSTFRGELAGSFVIWMFWMVGAAIASGFWGNLGWCSEFNACRVLSAIVAFSWLAWVTITFNFVVSLIFIIANGALLEPLHGQWVPQDAERASEVTERK
ncbi:hypothetical protein HMN09_01248200 [Mycena chlorophos]|uniref:MARVEL domain-containing protein n=1 Tax=Mycena chlorophos TaxID=658473 RepID=A0A8H6VTP3_MYCCL|nr:hypothetical protein HMN09_01248200 [Mycena chlorophos]